MPLITTAHGPRKLTYVPSPADDRDLPIDMMPMKIAAGQVGSNLHLVADGAPTVPIFDQGGAGSCTGQGTSTAYARSTVAAGLPLRIPARMDIYGKARIHDDGLMGLCKDEGSYVRSALWALHKPGVCSEDAWPYDDKKVHERAPLAALEEGYDHRLSIQAYYRIVGTGDQRLNAIEMAIRSDHPVVFGTQVGQPFCDFVADPEKPLVWGPPHRPVGGHCMCIDGVRVGASGKLEFRLVNSWGTGWGESGYAWADESWIADPWSNDFWVMTL